MEIVKNREHLFPRKVLKNITNYLRGLGADLSRRTYVFIDEIQYLDDPTHFLKLIFDTHPSIKLFVTGSSTLEIRRKFKDSLAGRKIVFELAPLDFSEFLLFNGEKKLAELVEQYSLRQIVARGTIADFPLRPFQEKLLELLALQIGNLFNLAETAKSLQMARETVERYLVLLENTFIIKRIILSVGARFGELRFFLMAKTREKIWRNYSRC